MVRNEIVTSFTRQHPLRNEIVMSFKMALKRWTPGRPADRTKKHGSAFACVHRKPTRSQVAQEIRKRSSFVERNYYYYYYYYNRIYIKCLDRLVLRSPNRPFAGSGHMARNKLHWDANDVVGLSKQRNSYQFSPTFLFRYGWQGWEWIEILKNWPIFSSFDATSCKNPQEPSLIKFTWCLRRSLTEAFCLWLKP